MERLRDDSFLRFVNTVFHDNIPWRIVKALTKEEGGLTLRELARRVGVAPKTLYRHIDRLQRAGVLEVHKPSPRVKLIRLNGRYIWLKEFLGEAHGE
jgi:predicted DNA-binding transcriptional regulator YafY